MRLGEGSPEASADALLPEDLLPEAALLLPVDGHPGEPKQAGERRVEVAARSVPGAPAPGVEELRGGELQRIPPAPAAPAGSGEEAPLGGSRPAAWQNPGVCGEVARLPPEVRYSEVGQREAGGSAAPAVAPWAPGASWRGCGEACPRTARPRERQHPPEALIRRPAVEKQPRPVQQRRLAG